MYRCKCCDWEYRNGNSNRSKQQWQRQRQLADIMVNELLLIWRLKIMATCGQQMAAAVHWPLATGYWLLATGPWSCSWPTCWPNFVTLAASLSRAMGRRSAGAARFCLLHVWVLRLCEYAELRRACSCLCVWLCVCGWVICKRLASFLLRRRINGEHNK